MEGKVMRAIGRVSAVFLLLAWAAEAGAARYLAGEFNNWNPAAKDQLMTDNGDGTYTATLSGLALNSRYEFKITDGTWGWSFPGANSWLYTDDKGGVTITFNENTVNDGWMPIQNRLGLSTDPGRWTIAGSFQGWDNANPQTAMSSMGCGLYQLQQTLDPGSYEWKAVVTGSWDSISTDGRSINTANAALTVKPGEENVIFYVDALAGTVGINTPLRKPERAHDPSPENLAVNVSPSNLVLSWTVSDPNDDGRGDPNVRACNIYIGTERIDPNLFYRGTVSEWDPLTLRASFPFAEAKTDTTYFWRVDMVRDDDTVLTGFVWTFETEKITPQITANPDYQVVEAGSTAEFSVAVSSPSPETYQWYRVVEGGSDITLADSAKYAGTTSNTLIITDVQLSDEGSYYCIINNESGIPAVSERAWLGVKRRIAYWPFEGDNPDSIVPGSPTSLLYGAPAFTSDGVVGNAMEFDADAEAPDLLYTDPEKTSYFAICNHSMTIACWIKSSWAATWGPIVARNGEGNEGWQLRHSGFTLDRICFTTRGTGNDDGTPSNRTVYDGQWHYVVATYGGTEKKIYIDGVISRVYNADDGTIAREADEVSGRINPTASPISLAGRVRGDAINGLIFEDVTPCILDEVEIYNYAMDAATIAQNYANRTGLAVCPTPLPYDLDNNCVIDLNDLALLAGRWLTDTRVKPIPY